jgi:hypothetical protein
MTTRVLWIQATLILIPGILFILVTYLFQHYGNITKFYNFKNICFVFSIFLTLGLIFTIST